MLRPKNLIHEIHRRSLWQVLGIYVVGSWFVLQVVDTLAGALNLPDWAPAFALFLLIVGLPIVLATAFLQEGPRGSKALHAKALDAEAVGPKEPGAHHRLLTWRNAILGGVGATLLWGGFAAGWFLFGRSGGAEATLDVPGAEVWIAEFPTAEARTAEDAAEDRPSIAVLPLANRSALEEDAFFVDGIHDDILTHLSKIDGLKVSARTSVMQYRESPPPIRQIAEELNVATVLEGGVQRAGERGCA